MQQRRARVLPSVVMDRQVVVDYRSWWTTGRGGLQVVVDYRSRSYFPVIVQLIRKR